MSTDTANDRVGPGIVNRRRFLHGAGGALAMYAFGGLGRVGPALAKSPSLPDPDASGIDHVVVVMMENRSFDHFLGWLKDADGRQGGLKYRDREGILHATHRLAPDFQGCGHPDPDHSYDGGRVEYNGGAADGWLRAGENDEYSIGYYTKQDLSFFGQAAGDWTVCDRYFAAIMAETFPNRIYQHAAQTDRLENTVVVSTLPTIWDRLEEAGLDGRYYFTDVPVLALWGTKYRDIGRPFDAFIADAAAGTLPHVAFVDPRFVDEDSGTSEDDHPHADIRNGQAFLNRVYTAVATSPAWSRTVLVFNYDEWGGFFDHVPPTSAPIPPADQAAGNADGLRGFRVPCLVVSPYSGGGRVSNIVLDHTSVLRMIEWRWGLTPLTIRDASASNLAEVLDFKGRQRRRRLISVPTGPFGGACPSSSRAAGESDKWAELLAMATALGWR